MEVVRDFKFFEVVWGLAFYFFYCLEFKGLVGMILISNIFLFLLEF